jgi:hypothetical protein
VIDAYKHPNKNQIPAKVANFTAQSLPIGTPNLQKLLDMTFVVKGRSIEGCRDYLKQVVGRLLSRLELLRL